MRLAEKVRASQVPSEGSSLLGLTRIFRSKAMDRGAATMEMRASSGYAFSQEESGGQERVTRAYDTTKPKTKKAKSGR